MLLPALALATLAPRFEPVPAGGYQVRGPGQTIRLGAGAATLDLETPLGARRIDLHFGGESPIGVGPDAGAVSWFLGNDPACWQAALPVPTALLHRGVGPGVDLVFHFRDGKLEQDFVLAPGAEPAAIRLRVAGADRLALTDAGALRLEVGGRTFEFHAPRSFQASDAGPEPVRSRFVPVAGSSFGFQVEGHDPARTLVIDPVIDFGTLFGGGSSESGSRVRLAADGGMVLAGRTSSTDLPLTAPLTATLAGETDIYVARLDASGQQLLFATYLGGSGDEGDPALAVGPDGAIYLAGWTDSADFPVTAGTPQTLARGGRDAFVARIAADGSALEWSTYLGGSAADRPFQLDVGPFGELALVGESASADFPSVRPILPVPAAGSAPFAAILTADGSALAFSTRIDPSLAGSLAAVALDDSGSLWLGGARDSTSFATICPRIQGGLSDAVVLAVDPTLPQVILCTSTGGSGDDRVTALALDDISGVYVAGETFSDDLPVVNALQPVSGGATDAFVGKFSASGGAWAWLTYLGGPSPDRAEALAVNPDGDVYVAGDTGDFFPAIRGFPCSTTPGSQNFLARLSPDGSRLIWSVSFGGTGFDQLSSLALDGIGRALVGGDTRSVNFPVLGGYQTRHAGGAMRSPCGLPKGRPARPPDRSATGSSSRAIKRR